MGWFKNMKVTAKLLTGFILVAMIAGVIGFIGIRDMKKIAEGTEQMYERMMEPTSLLMEIAVDFQKIRVHTRELLLADNDAARQTILGNIRERRADIEKLMKEFDKTVISADTKALNENMKATRDGYYRALDNASALIQAGRLSEAQSYMNGEGLRRADEFQASLDKMADLKVSRAKTMNETATATANSAVTEMLVLIGGGILLAIILGVSIARAIVRPIKSLVESSERLARGDVNVSLETGGKDEVGVLTQSFSLMANNIRDAALALERVAEGDFKVEVKVRSEHDVLGQSLSKLLKTSSGLMQETNELIQATKQGQLDRRANAAAFSGEWGVLVGGVNQLVDAFVGPINVTAEYVDRISKGDIPPKITDVYHGDFNEIKNNLNNCIDTMNGLLKETGELIQATKQGQLDRRANAAVFNGEWGVLVGGVNQLVDAFVGPINVTAEYVDRISKGDIPPKISDVYYGDFNEIKNNLNNCIDTMNGLLKETGELIQATKQGQLDRRANASVFSGEWGVLVGGVNQLVDAFVGPINVTAEYVDRISKGDIPPKISDVYHGDFNEIKNNLNNCIDTMNGLLKETGELIQATKQGQLDRRANAAAFSGEWGALVGGVNQLVDAFVGPINVTAEYVDRISKGDIPPKISDVYHGDFNEIKNNLNNCIDNISALVKDADLLVQAAIEGKLSTRADATKHGGDYRKIVEGVNRTLDAVIGPLNVAASYVERISKGDIPPQITDSYNGDFNAIKNNLNVCIAAVKSLVEDSNMLADAALEGRLNTRADAGRHSGDFRRIVDGVNHTLDSVLEPIKEASSCLEEIAKGNLDTEVKGEYKGDHAMIKQALNQSLESINEVLNQVNIAVDQVAAGSRQVSDSSQALSNGATQSASAVEEISSSMHEMAAQTNQNADNANQASQLSTMARDQAEKGNEQMNNMVKAMDDINQSATNISKIIKVIDEIAFQTNLLALNAAVEAARAGKHGKGFTVVAEEVRNLAQRSAKAAKETTEMIEDSIKRTEVGTKIAQDTAESLGEIVRGAVKVTDLISEIAAASREQAQGINQINQALGQVDQVTQQNTASAEESAAASEELSSQAMQLKETVGKFKLRRMERYAGAGDFSGRRMEYGGSRRQERNVSQNKSMMRDEPISIHLDDKDFGNF